MTTDWTTRAPVAVELFCGVGGMTLGFRQAGMHIASGFDANELAVASHATNFPDVASVCADVSTLSARTIRRDGKLANQPVDVVFGGPPCQGFSVGGTMDPSDDRNVLLLEFARLVSELQPSYFAVENVVGLMNSRYASLVSKFERTIGAAGYTLTKPYRVLDAAAFGVPQRRRRVFLLGSREGCVPVAYPKPIPQRARPTVWNAIRDVSLAFDWCSRHGVDTFVGQLRAGGTYAKIMRGDMRDPLDRWPPRRRPRTSTTGFASTMHSPETVRRFLQLDAGEQDPVSRFIRLRKDGISTTLRAGTGLDRGRFMAPRPIHPIAPRCICLREAARIHSFPDWFEFHDTKWHGFMQIGNSVPPRLARAVGLEIVRAFEATQLARGTGSEAA